MTDRRGNRVSEKNGKPEETAEWNGITADLGILQKGLQGSGRKPCGASELLSVLINHTPDCIYVKDTSGGFVLNNRVHLRLLGVADQKGCLGKTDYDFFPHESAARYRSDEALVFRYGTPIIDREEKVVDHCGREHWFSTTKVPLRNDDGKVTGLVGISRDITHRKEGERRQEEVQRQLDHNRRLESLGRMAGGISHDFNNMLTAIVGYAGVLKRKLADRDPELSGYAGTILDASGRAGELIRKLLTFSRQSKKITEPVDMHQTITDVIHLLEYSIDKRIRVTHGLNARNAIVNGDRSQLENALLNLGMNARDAMPIGGRIAFETSSLTARPDFCDSHPYCRPGKTYLIIEVIDTGVGMDAATAEQIFEPFFTTKPSGKGTGLGLASVYGTVKAHDGHIVVESAPAQGTRFRLYFPAIEKQDEPPRDESGGEYRGCERILLVDDEEYVLSATAMILREIGYEVETCSSAIEAINQYYNDFKRYDLVIVDMIMPDMKGADLMTKLKDINPDVKMIGATGHMNSGDTQMVRSKHVAGFIRKPYERGELASLVRWALAGSMRE